MPAEAANGLNVCCMPIVHYILERLLPIVFLFANRLDRLLPVLVLLADGFDAKGAMQIRNDSIHAKAQTMDLSGV